MNSVCHDAGSTLTSRAEPPWWIRSRPSLAPPPQHGFQQEREGSEKSNKFPFGLFSFHKLLLLSIFAFILLQKISFRGKSIKIDVEE
jgi:hypothetical protein